MSTLQSGLRMVRTMMKGERTKKAKMKEMAGVTETMTMIAPVKMRKMKRGRGGV